MTAIETVMLMDLALRAGDQSLIQEAYSSYLDGYGRWERYLPRIKKLRNLLDEAGIVLGHHRWMRVRR